MTDPVSGEMASRAAEQVADGQEGPAQVDETPGEADFSELMGADRQAPAESENGTDAGEAAGIEGPEEIDRVEEVSETEMDDFVQRMLHEESDIQQMMDDCLDGGEVGQKEMLQMQALVYSYSQRVDLTTKVVEQATGGVEKVMNTQV